MQGMTMQLGNLHLPTMTTPGISHAPKTSTLSKLTPTMIRAQNSESTELAKPDPETEVMQVTRREVVSK